MLPISHMTTLATSSAQHSSHIYNAAINPSRPTIPSAAPRTAVGIAAAPPAVEEALAAAAVALLISLLALLAIEEATEAAALASEVTTEPAAEVKEE